MQIKKMTRIKFLEPGLKEIDILIEDNEENIS